MSNLIQVLKGGQGSGDWGHTGRPGKRGGSGGGKPKKRHVIIPTKNNQKVEILGPGFLPGFIKVRDEKGNVDNKVHKSLLFTKGSSGKLSAISEDMIPKKQKPSGPIKITEEIGVSDRKDDGKSLTVYHATTEDAIQSILKEGLRKSKSNPNNVIPIPAGVYFSDSKITGEEYGASFVGMEKFAVIEFEIPAKGKSKVHPDMHDRTKYEIDNAFYYEDKIPPKWITNVHIFSETGGGQWGYEQTDTIRKQATRKSFSVVGIKEPTEKKTKLKDVYYVLIGYVNE